MYITQREFVERVYQRGGGVGGRFTHRDAMRVIEAALEEITDTLASGGEVQLIGFGTFYVKERKARVGFNPQTRQRLEIPGKRVAAFRPGVKLQRAITPGPGP